MDQILLNSTADVFKKEYVIKADQADENKDLIDEAVKALDNEENNLTE